MTPLVLTGCRIHTMDARRTVASAIAIADGQVLAVGPAERVLAVSPAGAQREDLAGATIVPGLIDAHNHLLATGRALAQVQLFDCRSIGEIVERVAGRVRELPPGTWVLGRGWDESLLAERRHPTRHDLDPVSPDHPVLLERVWNKLVCNSRALAIAGVSRDTPDPSARIAYAGSFERDGDGNPTGLFRDRAKALIRDHVPSQTHDGELASVELACRAYNAVGLTTVCEPGLYPDEIRTFHHAARTARLTVRTELMMAAWGWGGAEEEADLPQRLGQVGFETGFGDSLLRLGGIKILPDGGIGDRTARVSEPYLDEPSNHGTWVVDPDDLRRFVRFAHDHGWAIDTHTCGDEAQAVTVAAYAAAQEASPKPWLRHRVHHAYFPTDQSLALMAHHRIPAVVSNPFLALLGESFVSSIGEERARRAMPMRTYLSRGVPLAGSSDSNVSDYDPWFGMYAACTRRTELGRVLDAAEALTAAEALAMYTSGGAYAIGREHDLGSLEPGKLADLVVLEEDPLAITVEELRTVRPARTMLGGRWV